MSRKLPGIVFRSVLRLTRAKSSSSRSSGSRSRRRVPHRRPDGERAVELRGQLGLEPRALAQQGLVARLRQRPPVAEPPQHAPVEPRGVRAVEQRVVNAPRLVRDEAAVLVEQRAHGRERRERPALDRRAGLRERGERVREGAGDGRLGLVGEVAFGHDEARRGRRERDGLRQARAAQQRRRARRASATVVASGPTLSSVGASGRIPARSTRAAVGLNPTSPQNAAGTRIEPDVSVPIAHATTPLATATAEPDEEPPGIRSGPRPRGLGGVPKCGFRPEPGVRELGQVRLAGADHARGGEPRDDRGVGARRRRVAPQRRGRRGRHALDVDQVLPRDRDAVERPERRARPQPRGARLRLAARPLLGDGDERGTGRARPRQRLLRQRDRVQLARREPPAELERARHLRRRPRRAGSGGAARRASCAPPPGGRRDARPRRGPPGRA